MFFVSNNNYIITLMDQRLSIIGCILMQCQEMDSIACVKVFKVSMLLKLFGMKHSCIFLLQLSFLPIQLYHQTQLYQQIQQHQQIQQQLLQLVADYY